jgi:hypothetical protein
MKIRSGLFGIVIANLFIVAFVIISVVGIWWKSMYSVGMSVSAHRVIILTTVVIIFFTVSLSWITLKITRKPK